MDKWYKEQGYYDMFYYKSIYAMLHVWPGLAWLDLIWCVCTKIEMQLHWRRRTKERKMCCFVGFYYILLMLIFARAMPPLMKWDGAGSGCGYGMKNPETHSPLCDMLNSGGWGMEGAHATHIFLDTPFHPFSASALCCPQHWKMRLE